MVLVVGAVVVLLVLVWLLPALLRWLLRLRLRARVAAVVVLGRQRQAPSVTVQFSLREDRNLGLSDGYRVVFCFHVFQGAIERLSSGIVLFFSAIYGAL